MGLGNVGLPLDGAFSEHLHTVGFDIIQLKTDSLKVTDSKIQATNDPYAIKDADLVLICVPTPVTKAKDPDLLPVQSADAHRTKSETQCHCHSVITRVSGSYRGDHGSYHCA